VLTIAEFRLEGWLRHTYSPVGTDSVTAQPSAFLSHASEDKPDFAEPLGRALAELGIKPWLDKWEIRPGDSLIQKLFDEGLATVSAVVVMISESSASKSWVREELDAAMVARITHTTRLIPVRLDAAEMPPPLRHLVWINADRTAAGVEKAARQIADTLHARNLGPAVADPPMYTRVSVLPGLTSADTTLLIAAAEEAITCYPSPILFLEATLVVIAAVLVRDRATARVTAAVSPSRSAVCRWNSSRPAHAGAAAWCAAAMRGSLPASRSARAG
jgi:hypothetical protein